MSSSESNELRCIAHQVIFDLHKAKELSQIQLLFQAAALAYKSLDREKFATACEALVQTIPTLTASLRELAMIRELMASTHPVTLWQDVTLTCYVTTKGMTYQGHTLKEALTKAS